VARSAGRRHTSGDGAAEAAGGPTVAINLSYLEVDDPVVVAVMEALLRIAVTVRDVASSVSLRGNDKVTNASSASFALALATVSGIRSVDLTGKAMTVDGLRTMVAAVSRLAVKPEVVLPNGEHFDADSSLAGGSSSLNAAAAAGVAAGTATTTTTTATGPKPRGAAGTGVVGLRASHSSSSTGSAVDLNALRKRRDDFSGRRTWKASMRPAKKPRASRQSSRTLPAVCLTPPQRLLVERGAGAPEDGMPRLRKEPLSTSEVTFEGYARQ
jgi:hypothetical protein